MNQTGRQSAGIVDLVVQGEPVAATSSWVGFAIVAAVAIAIVGCVVIRARMRPDHERRAFVKLSRRLGLSRRERLEAQMLAIKSGIQPVAVLICPSALRRAMQTSGDGAARRGLALKIETKG